jgi:hypothetical protein
LLFNYQFIEFQNQVLRQLVTLNARTIENAEYLHILMLIIDEIKEKIVMINPPPTSSFQYNNLALNDIFSKFPILNNEQLKCITNNN